MLWDLHPTPTPSQDPNSSLTQLHNDEIVLREDDFLQPSRCLSLASGFLGSNFNKLFFFDKVSVSFLGGAKEKKIPSSSELVSEKLVSKFTLWLWREPRFSQKANVSTIEGTVEI